MVKNKNGRIIRRILRTTYVCKYCGNTVTKDTDENDHGSAMATGAMLGSMLGGGNRGGSGFGGGFGSWNLHEGLNVSLGLSVFSTFGSGGTWSGAGFGQNVAMLYAKPLTDRLSIAAGGYLSNATWADWQVLPILSLHLPTRHSKTSSMITGDRVATPASKISTL